MKKKTKMLSLSLVVLLAILVLVANIWRRQSLVRDIRVDIDYGTADTLVTSLQIEQQIRAAMPHLTSTMLRDVDLKSVQHLAAASPYLSDCKAGTSIGRDVVVFASQRRPIVRICAQQEYYLSHDGSRLPISSVGSADVLVASGSISTQSSGEKEVLTLADYLDSHPQLSPLFDQIYRDANGDLFLVPKLGNHVVQLGSVAELDDKFHRLMEFYTRGLPQVGWEQYDQISVKYRGQVVCTKRNQNN
jgi:cell division protein FtsQ